jgi:hypothetical protein
MVKELGEMIIRAEQWFRGGFEGPFNGWYEPARPFYFRRRSK